MSRGRKNQSKTTWSSVRTDISLSKPSIVEKYKLNNEMEWVDEISECPEFRPSMEEFKDPLVYLQTIAPQASKYGICKIVSPWKACVPASDVLMKEQRGFQFKAYIQHLRLHEWNVNDKAAFLMRQRKYTYQSFEKMANKAFAKRFTQSTNISAIHLEKEFWHEMARGIRMVDYGANIDGSAFSSDPNDELGQSNGNLKILPQLSNCTLRLLEYQIPGITFPMLYIGMLFSTFAWHVEDHYLYSINYHHSGAPKTWYGVPGYAASGFEKVAHDYIYAPGILSPMDEDGASALLAEKTTMFPPNILLQHNVPVYKAVQMPGEYVITFPRAYHAGFSHGKLHFLPLFCIFLIFSFMPCICHLSLSIETYNFIPLYTITGFNCGEAVNFAVGDWFPWGAVAGQAYAQLCKMVILPYEELLCKEAIILSKSNCLSNEPAPQTLVKISFLSHIESLSNVLWHLNNLKAPFSYSPNSQGTIVCQICKRDSYLAFLGCNSCFHHTCLFHEVHSLTCSCSGKLVVFLRENIWEVADTYEKFQQKSCFSSLPNMSSCIKHGLTRTRKVNFHCEYNGTQESVKPTKGTAIFKMKEKEKVQLGVRKNHKRHCYKHEIILQSFPKSSKKARRKGRLKTTGNNILGCLCAYRPPNIHNIGDFYDTPTN
ncbi:hypothetical protein DITRI_Ditri06bG0105200 [Diplodiscus trichospermus]